MRAPRALGGDPVEGVVADREERAPQGPGQRDGVERVLDGGQDVDQVEDLLLGEEARAADDVVVEPLGHQGRLVGRRVGERAEQERDVALGGRLGVAGRFGRGPSSPRRAAAEVPGQPAGLVLAAGVGVGLRAAGRASGGSAPEEGDGGRAVRVGRGPPPAGGRRPRSGKVVGEQGVDEVEDRRDAPEVLGQVEPAGLGEPVAVVAEELGPGPPEPVDRLLEVADQEQPPSEQAGAGQVLEDLGLDRVGVLELVDQDQVDRAGQGLADGLRAVRQQVAGQEQEVVVVDPAPRPLGPVVGLPGVDRPAGRTGGRGRRPSSTSARPRRGPCELLGLVADRLEVVLDRLDRPRSEGQSFAAGPGPWPAR